MDIVSTKIEPENDGQQNVSSSSLVPTLANHVERYLASKKDDWQASTCYIFRMVLTQFSLFVGTQELTEQLVDRWRAKIGKNHFRGNTRLIYLDKTRPFLKWCYLEGITGTDLSLSFGPSRYEFQPPKTITPEQYEQIKTVFQQTKWYHAVILAYRAGLRLNDIALLKWTNIDLENLIITYRPMHQLKKNPVTVTVPFAPRGDLHEALLSIHSQRHNAKGYVSPELANHWWRYEQTSIGGRRIANYPYSKKLRSKFNFTILRNSFIMNLLRTNPPISAIFQMTGISDTRSIVRYMSFSVKDLHGIAEKMEAQA